MREMRKKSQRKLGLKYGRDFSWSEIENLEKKLVKYKQVKQGLMQNLLTGKVRLV